MNKLIANETAYKTLAAALRGGRLSHALLIEGPDGCGKMTFAREVAQAALCRAGGDEMEMDMPLLAGAEPPPPAERPCGVCRDCLKVEKNIHPDVLSYGGGGTSRSFHVDTVRALRQEAYVRPNEADGKALLLRDTHEMSLQAQNALLKIIEEPPAGVTFVLTCENRSAMLETIRSRVQVIALETPSVEQCAAFLERRVPDGDPARILEAAERAGGNVGRALRLLEEDGGGEAVRAADILYDACIGDELEALASLMKYERDRPGMTGLLERMGAALSAALLREPADERLRQLLARAGRLRLLQILAIIEDAAQAAAQNAGGPLLAAGLCAKIRSVLAD